MTVLVVVVGLGVAAFADGVSRRLARRRLERARTDLELLGKRRVGL